MKLLCLSTSMLSVKISAVLFLIIASLQAHNRVVIKDFDWKIYETEHFLIHYYGTGEKILPFVVKYLEEAHNLVTSGLDYTPPEKTPFFLYIGRNDFEQTSIADVGEGTGGFAEIFKYRFVLPFTGSFGEFHHVLTHEFVHIVEFNILYGQGLLKTARFMKKPFYPLWLLEGLAEYYGARDNFVERNVIMRDRVHNNLHIPISKLHNFRHLKPGEVWPAYKISEEFMYFIADEYGEEKLAEMLKNFTKTWDSDTVLRATIGIGLEEADRKFREYITDKYSIQIGTKNPPQIYGKQITTHLKFPHHNTDPVISPNGNYIAYITNKNGFNEIVLFSTITKRTHTIISRNFFDENENINTSGRALVFSKDSNLILFAGERKQQDFLYIYNIKTKKLQRMSPATDALRTPTFLNKNKIIFSGMKDAQTDIFMYDLSTKELKNLTNDIYDDIDPYPHPDGTKIIFSKEILTNDKERPYGYDLYLYDLNTSTQIPISQLKGDEKNPIFINEDEIIFVSDNDTFPNLYLLNLKTNEIKKLTDLITDCSEPSVSGEKITFSSLWNGTRHIFLSNLKKLIPKTTTQLEIIEVKEFPKPKELTKKPEEYKTRLTTDLLVPIFFYTTYHGLSTLFHWQASDYLGHNRLNLSLLYSEFYKRLEYEAAYSYNRFIPYITFTLQGRRHRRLERHLQKMNLTFPLSRFERTEFDIINYFDSDPPRNDPQPHKRNAFKISFIRETLSGEYLEPLSGELLYVGTEFADYFWGGNINYQNFIIELRKYFPIHHYTSLMLRFVSANSFGTHARLFPLGDRRGIRGYPPKNYPNIFGPNILILNTEFKFPIAYDVNYHMYFIFPDLFLKSFYGFIFYDCGTNYSLFTHTTGLGTRLFAFVLQMFPLNFDLAFAYNFETRKIEIMFMFAMYIFY